MTDKKPKNSKPENSKAEQVSAAEALKRMKSFSERKEKFVALIKKSQD